MKKLIILLGVLVMLLPLIGRSEDGQQREQIVGVNSAFVPGSPGRSGEFKVVANGLFPNGCYRWSRSEVDHVDDNTHYIRSYALVTEGMCIMVLVPFTEEINLGILRPGEHRLRFVNGDGTHMERRVTIQ